MQTMARTPQRNPTVPTAVRPATPGGQRSLCGYVLTLLSTATENQISVNPLGRTINMNPRTWSWFKNHNTAMLFLVSEKAEAVRTMQTRMIDVSGYSSAPTVPLGRSKPVVAVPTGIKALCGAIQELVGDMAATGKPTDAQQMDFAARYGKHRDAMASLRAAFLEAEGQFETAQTFLVQMMGDDQ
jgi:hypothetical protein